MPVESLPSKNAAILDVPEVQGLTAEFQYFYWTADEYENGLGSSKAALQQLPSETFDASFVSLTRRLPRLIKLNWRPVTLNRSVSQPQNPIKIRDFLSKLHSEETFTSNDFTTFHYQDTGADLRLKFFVDRFAALLPNLETVNSADEVIGLINSQTSDQVTAQFLAEIISNLSRQGVEFRDRTQAETSVLNRMKNVALNTRLNNRFLVPIAKTVKEDSVGVFADELSSDTFTNKIETIQNAAISNANSNLLSPLDYEFEVLSYVGYRPVDTNGYEPSVESLGYLLEKREIRSDGTQEQHPPVIIENPFVSTTYDGQVRYNSVYYYRIRGICLVEVRAVDEVTKQNLLVSFLVGSKFSPEKKVVTVENVPPPPPADFNVAWDYGERALRCTWNLPSNPQQDIKYIQLFRRKSIADPFQLIKMWDFNNTQTRVTLSEYPLPELVERVPEFVGIYLDREFGKDSNYIYAVAAIDAHGLCSNYSLQLQVGFDRFENRLIKKLVSVSGAPKQYPNAYLNADTFVDTIKDSGHTNIRVVFNPDYLNLVNGTGADLKLLKTSRVNGKYKLQLINVDLQTQQNIDITLQDSRLTASNNRESR
jgi:hypothetical protein